MQIFRLHEDMRQSAKWYCDKHMKIILEATQVLCTVVNESGGESPYKTTHKNHPITAWARQSLSNWKWIREFVSVLNDENNYRYRKDHKSALIARDLQEPNIDDIGLTPFPLAMPNVYKNGNLEKSYRKYYVCEKKHFCKWTNRPVPYWIWNH